MANWGEEKGVIITEIGARDHAWPTERVYVRSYLDHGKKERSGSGASGGSRESHTMPPLNPRRGRKRVIFIYDFYQLHFSQGSSRSVSKVDVCCFIAGAIFESLALPLQSQVETVQGPWYVISEHTLHYSVTAYASVDLEHIFRNDSPGYTYAHTFLTSLTQKLFSNYKVKVVPRYVNYH